MRVLLLHRTDCPNVEATRSQLRLALSSRGYATEWQELDLAQEQAVSLAHFGSPTVLVNGADVAGPQASESSCCRVYPASDGTITGVPDAELIGLALDRAGRGLGRYWWGTFSLGAILCPLSMATCPTCWPVYGALLSAAGVSASNQICRLAFSVLLIASLVPLVRLIGRLRCGEAALAVVTGLALLIESFWLQQSYLAVLGSLILTAGSLHVTLLVRSPQDGIQI